MNYLAFSLLGSPAALDSSNFFTQLVELLFGGASDLIQQLGSLIRSTALSLIYADGLGTSQDLSVIFVIVVTIAGISIVFGLVFGTFHWLKNGLRRLGRR